MLIPDKRIIGSLLGLMLVVSFSACSRPLENSAGNPEVGKAAGEAATGTVQTGQNARTRDTEIIGKPEVHAMMTRDEYMPECLKTCQSAQTTDTSKEYCGAYCDCTYEAFEVRVPIADLRAFVRKEQNPSGELIAEIIRQCRALVTNPGGSPGQAER